MTTQIEAYIRSLALEYLSLIEMLDSPDHDAYARRELSAQRSHCHDELIRVLGSDYDRPFPMETYCRQLLSS